MNGRAAVVEDTEIVEEEDSGDFEKEVEKPPVEKPKPNPDDPPETAAMRAAREAARRSERREKEMARRVRDLESRLNRYGEMEKSFSNIQQGLRLLSGQQAETDKADEDDALPPDPVDDAEGYSEWQKRQREKMVQSAREEAATTAKITVAEQRRYDLSNAAGKQFFEQYPELAKPENWEKIKVRVNYLHSGKMGTGPDGTITVEDLYAEAHKDRTLRSLLSTQKRRQRDNDMLSGLRDAAQPVPRGNINIKDLATKTPEEIAQILKSAGLNSKEAAALYDQLPDELAFQVDFGRP